MVGWHCTNHWINSILYGWTSNVDIVLVEQAYLRLCEDNLTNTFCSLYSPYHLSWFFSTCKEKTSYILQKYTNHHPELFAFLLSPSPEYNLLHLGKLKPIHTVDIWIIYPCICSSSCCQQNLWVKWSCVIITVQDIFINIYFALTEKLCMLKILIFL